METFSSIVVCIEYGRLGMTCGLMSLTIVFDNIKKVILYLLPAGTFCELWPILFTIFFGLPQPLSAIQMIIISMLTDCVASMSLIKEKPEADLLLRMPRRPEKDRLANIKLLVQAYLIVGVPMLVCANAMAFRVFAQAGIPFSSLWLSFGNVQVNGQPVDPILYQNTLYRAQSVYFVTLVLMQWANLLMTRTRRLSIIQQLPIGSKETRNLFIFMAMGFTLSVLVLFIFTPFFQNIFHTRDINVQYWFIRRFPVFLR
jgi:sodium/potassium-transporting ATPase subunit alpha